MKQTALETYKQQAVDSIEAKLKFILEKLDIEFVSPVEPIRKPQMRQLVSLQNSDAMLDAILKKMQVEYPPVAETAVTEPEAALEVEPAPEAETGQPEQGQPDSQVESSEASDAESQPAPDEPSATAESDEPEEKAPDETVG